ncbi:MAG: tyrosine-type recombinase/integrase [Hyphomicrobium sp.]
MATFDKLPSGYWRAQVRRKRKHLSKTFRLKADAEVWALDIERAVETGKDPRASKIDPKACFSSIIDLHIADLAEVGKPLLRGKALCLENLRRDLGNERLVDLTRERIIRFGKDRAREGAGPVTVGIDIGYIKTLLVHAAAVHGVEVPTEQVSLARVALRRLGLVGKGNERDRRPTEDELHRIIFYNDNNPRQGIPVGRLVKFAVATAMRLSEICALRWADIDFSMSLAMVRNRKDPRRKSGNNQLVPLLDATGYDAVARHHAEQLTHHLDDHCGCPFVPEGILLVGAFLHAKVRDKGRVVFEIDCQWINQIHGVERIRVTVAHDVERVQFVDQMPDRPAAGGGHSVVLTLGVYDDGRTLPGQKRGYHARHAFAGAGRCDCQEMTFGRRVPLRA